MGILPKIGRYVRRLHTIGACCRPLPKKDRQARRRHRWRDELGNFTNVTSGAPPQQAAPPVKMAELARLLWAIRSAVNSLSTRALLNFAAPSFLSFANTIGQLRHFALRKNSEPFRLRTAVKWVTDLPIGT
jgi:hypothetical protein